MDDTTYQLLAPDVRTAAKTAARDWPGVIDEDDAESEIWLVLLESGQGSLDIVAGMDRPMRVTTLTVYGHRIAASYRDDYELFSGNYRYGTEEVRALLTAGILLAASGEKPGSLTHTIRIDLNLGMERLVKKNARYADLLTQKYVKGVDFDREDPDRFAVGRAVDALTLEMNRVNLSRSANYTEGPGTRSAVSNSRGQNDAATNWQGDASEGRR